MNLGEIKIQTLILMRAHVENGPQDICVADLPSLMGTEAYGEYLIGMTGAINRCFSDIENKRALPTRAFVLPLAEGVAGYVRYDLSRLLPDFRETDSVVYSASDGTYRSDVPYRAEGGVLSLPAIDTSCEAYTLIYRPQIARVTSFTDDGVEIDVPDNIAQLIPYFLKSELYREDEVSEAEKARVFYEQGMAAVRNSRERYQGSVENIYVSEAW